MYASVASAASLSSQNISKFGTSFYGSSVKQIESFENNTKMMKTATTPPTSPNRLKLKEKLVGIYDSLLQVGRILIKTIKPCIKPWFYNLFGLRSAVTTRLES